MMSKHTPRKSVQLQRSHDFRRPTRLTLADNFAGVESFQFGNIVNTPAANVESELSWQETSRKGSVWMKQVVIAPHKASPKSKRLSLVTPEVKRDFKRSIDLRHPPGNAAQDDEDLDAEPTSYKVRMDKGGRIQIVYDEHEHNNYIIAWNSKFRRGWDIVIVLLVLYLCFNLPFSIAFEDYYFSKEFSTFMDILFYTDIVLNFRTGFVHNGEHVTNPRHIAGHYFKTYFFIDFLASVPFEILLEGFVEKTTRKSLKLIKWLKIPKLLRLGRIVKYLKRYGRYYFVFQAAMLTIFMIHLVGCMWMSIAEPCSAKDDKPCTQTEMEKLYFISLYMATMVLFGVTDVQSYIGLVDKTIQGSSGLKRLDTGYSRRLASYDLEGTWNNSQSSVLENPLIGVPRASYEYFDATFEVNRTYEYTVSDYSQAWWGQWSVLNPNKSYEVVCLYAIMMVGTFVGVGLLVAIIGEASTFSLARVDSYNRFFGKVDRIKTAMSIAHIPEDIQYRVVRFFDYLWVHQKQGYELLSDPDLPNPLKKELALHLHGPLLSSLSLFSGLSSDCLYAVALRLKTHIYMPNDVIFLKGDMAQQLYFIRRGNILVYLAEVDPELDLQPNQEESTKRKYLSSVLETDGGMSEEYTMNLAAEEGEKKADEMLQAEKEANFKAAGSKSRIKTMSTTSQPPNNKRASTATTLPASSQHSSTQHEEDPNLLIKVMGPGSYFGEIALLTDLPRVCTVSSQGMSELNELDRNDFEDVMAHFPELAGEVVESAIIDYPGLRPHLRAFARQVAAHSAKGKSAVDGGLGVLPEVKGRRVSSGNLGSVSSYGGAGERCSCEGHMKDMQRDVNDKFKRMELMLEKLTAISISNGRAIADHQKQKQMDSTHAIDKRLIKAHSMQSNMAQN